MRDNFEIFAPDTGSVEITSSNGAEFTIYEIGDNICVTVDAARDEVAHIRFTREQWNAIKDVIAKV